MGKEKKKRTGDLSPASLRKTYPGAGLASEIYQEDTLWLPSRSLPFNHLLGGGVPYGKIIEIFGEESSGKTLAAIDLAVVAQSLGGEIIWNDAEQAFTKTWAELNGLDLSRIHIWNDTAVEHISDWLADTAITLRRKLTHNEPIVFICDSLAALDCLENINSTQTDAKAEMGNRAKAIYKMLRIRNQLMYDLGIIGIYINQIRHKVGTTKWEDPDTTPGGRAMKFFASQRIGFYAGKQIKEKVNSRETRVGVWTSIRVKKNKVGPPRPTIKSPIYFNADWEEPIGFDRYVGLLDILIYLGVLTQKKSGMVYYKDELVARGEDAFVRKIRKDDDLRKKLIRKSGINTTSKTRKQLEELTTNLFPVTTKLAKFEKHSESEDKEEDDEE